MNLPKVKAGDDFLNSLQSKINLAEAEPIQKKISDTEKISVWSKLFGKNRNPWLIPSLSLTIVAIFIVSIYVLNTGKVKEVPTLSDFQKNTPSDIKLNDRVSDETKVQEKLSTKDAEGKTLSESNQNETSRKLNDEISKEPSKTPAPSYYDMDRSGYPTKINVSETKEETGKIAPSKDDKIIIQEKVIMESEKKVSEETNETLDKRIKGDEFDQKITSPAIKSEVKDGSENKGEVEKKEYKKDVKKDMRKSKPATDSTRIEKKDLEKIKEEIQKENK